MSKIVIIADDLTGANANGSLLAAKGFTAATCLDSEQWNTSYFSGFDAVSFNADSRLAKEETAKKAVYDATKLLVSDLNPSVVSKRIDSTLRGNLGTEIDAALKAMDDCASAGTPPTIALVVPSFPASGRIAVGGYLVVNGTPLEKTPIAKDPATPITSSIFTLIISEQSAHSAGHIPLNTVLSGPASVTRAIEDIRTSGARIICCDAVTDEDITTIAKAAVNLPFPILAVDPGPFTAALADVWVPKRIRHEHVDRALVVVGSTTELVRRQMESLRLSHRCCIERIDCMSLVNLAKRDRAIANVVEKIAARKDAAEVFGVCTVERAEDVLALEKMAAENGISLQEASERINTGLALVAEKLLAVQDLRLGGLYTSGGEVTVAVSRQLKASGFSVRDEVLPLAVYGRLIGGKYPEMPMITKGGFVGDSNSISQCVEYLFTKISSTLRSSD